MATKIFISYRRRDTATATDKLCEFLVKKFSSDYHIFRGVDHISNDSNYVKEVKEIINESAIVLIVIGHHFLTEVKEDDDFLQEIAHALKRQKRIILVLMNHANMPSLRELPEEIENLATSTLESFEISNPSGEVDYLKFYEYLISKSNIKHTSNLHVIGQLEEARSAFIKYEYREALRIYRSLLDFKKEFSVKDQAYLASIYLYGHDGVDKNCKQAWGWSSKAAEQGNAMGQFCLGRLFYYGCSGFRKDYKKSIEWFKKAATQGYAAAQNSLGLMYYNGEGVIEDYDQAVFWYRKAADQGNDAAQLNLGIMYSKGRGVVKDDVQAMLYYRKAADQGNRVANYNIGVLHESGKGVLKDINKAIRWYKKAADLGHAKAAERIKKIQNN